jgi:hypothetical protein
MMNEILPSVLVVCLVVLTIALVVVAINLIGVLIKAKNILGKADVAVDKANSVIDNTQEKIAGILNPFHSLSAFVSNFTAGLKVAEGFMSFVNKDKGKDKAATENPDEIEDEDKRDEKDRK